MSHRESNRTSRKVWEYINYILVTRNFTDIDGIMHKTISVYEVSKTTAQISLFLNTDNNRKLQLLL